MSEEWSYNKYQESPGVWTEEWVLYEVYWDTVVKCWINKKLYSKERKTIYEVSNMHGKGGNG